jgi:hypothetical protein
VTEPPAGSRQPNDGTAWPTVSCAGVSHPHRSRRQDLSADAAIYAIGALLSAFTVNAVMLLSSRTLIGLAIGADSAIATAYIAEFAPRERRGQLSIIQQWMITVGAAGAVDSRFRDVVDRRWNPQAEGSVGCGLARC